LDDEEDMLGLLLAEQRAVKDRGEEIKFERNESVELLVEEYARQLNNIFYETSYLLQKIQSKQEMIAISLDANRNRMIRMNIYLSIVTMIGE
jgi:magnesium transporter